MISARKLHMCSAVLALAGVIDTTIHGAWLTLFFMTVALHGALRDLLWPNARNSH